MKFIQKGKSADGPTKPKKSKDKKKEKKPSKETKAQEVKSEVTEEVYTENEAKGPIIIKFGKPVLTIKYSTIKAFVLIAIVLLIIDVIYALKLLINAIKLRVNFGYFINLISSPDGEVLPSCQAIPTFICLVIDLLAVYLLYKLFSEKKQAKINLFLYLLIVVGVLVILMIIVDFFFILSHIYAEHESLHDGMSDAMKSYASDSAIKSQIDRLQIEFQCCGSKKYEEWYEIQWYDATLVTGGNNSDTSSTPFSCCAMASSFPCVHHDIEKTGTAYLYTPEYNLSISTKGCYEIIRSQKKSIGWSIIGSLFLFSLCQAILLVDLRFLQTAHFEMSKFEGRKHEYTIWLLGCYRGRGKNTQAPEPPPVPPELMD